VADKIAESAEFFSFGTNDMTQMVFGYSRDDAGKFLGEFIDRNVLKHDPFPVAGSGRRGPDGGRWVLSADDLLGQT